MPESNLATQQHAHYPEEDELSLIELWNIVWKRKIWWLTLGPLAGVIGIIVAMTSTEIYRSEVLMAPAQNEEAGGGLSALAGQFGGLASIAGISLPGGSDTATAIATLRSRQFINSFIEERNLIPILFEDPKTDLPDDNPSLWNAYKAFAKILKISEDKKTGLITLAIEWEDPKLAQQWASDLSSRINRYLRDQAKEETEKNLAYLYKQVEVTELRDIEESLYALIQQQTQNAMLANATEEYAFRIIDPAVIPEERIRPQRTLIVLASGLLGGFLGLFLCFLFHFIDLAKKSSQSQKIPS